MNNTLSNYFLNRVEKLCNPITYTQLSSEQIEYLIKDTLTLGLNDVLNLKEYTNDLDLLLNEASRCGNSSISTLAVKTKICYKDDTLDYMLLLCFDLIQYINNKQLCMYKNNLSSDLELAKVKFRPKHLSYLGLVNTVSCKGNDLIYVHTKLLSTLFYDNIMLCDDYAYIKYNNKMNYPHDVAMLVLDSSVMRRYISMYFNCLKLVWAKRNGYRCDFTELQNSAVYSFYRDNNTCYSFTFNFRDKLPAQFYICNDFDNVIYKTCTLENILLNLFDCGDNHRYNKNLNGIFNIVISNYQLHTSLFPSYDFTDTIITKLLNRLSEQNNTFSKQKADALITMMEHMKSNKGLHSYSYGKEPVECSREEYVQSISNRFLLAVANGKDSYTIEEIKS